MKKSSSNKNKKKVSFEKLSPSQKRVTIAKDVIAQIKLGRYIADSGSYIANINFKNNLGDDEMHNKDIKKNFGKIKSCTVCAMGACLMSATKFANKLSFGDVGDSVRDLVNDKVKDLFSKLFSPEQLLLIETAFEGGGDDTDGDSRVAYDLFDLDRNQFEGSDFLQPSDEFRNNYYESEKRLIAIMENIIKNKGTFKP